MLPEFVRRGHRVVVARYAAPDFLESKIQLSGAEIVRLSGSTRLSWMRSMLRLLYGLKPDLIASFLKGPSSLALCARMIARLDIPIVVCERSLDPKGKSGPKQRLVRWLYGRSDAVICNSQAQCERIGSLSRRLHEKTYYIGNAVDLEAFPSTPHPSGRIDNVVVLGRAQKVKGLDVLVDAIRMHNEGRSGLTCKLPLVRWYGQGWEDVVGRFPTGLPDGGIEFHPPVSDVSRLISSADALLLPSLSEGTPNAVLESMSCGRPVIATEVGDVPHMVRDGVTGWLVKPNSPIELIKGLNRASQVDSQALDAMCSAARSRARSMAGISGIVDQYEGFFNQVMNRA